MKTGKKSPSQKNLIRWFRQISAELAMSIIALVQMITRAVVMTWVQPWEASKSVEVLAVVARNQTITLRRKKLTLGETRSVSVRKPRKRRKLDHSGWQRRPKSGSQ